MSGVMDSTAGIMLYRYLLRIFKKGIDYVTDFYRVYDSRGISAMAYAVCRKQWGTKMISGLVKWARDDGTGYVTSNGNTYYTDSSVCMCDWNLLDKDVKVTFKVVTILDKAIAVDVRLAT